jgi:hypothetical protein
VPCVGPARTTVMSPVRLVDDTVNHILEY